MSLDTKLVGSESQLAWRIACWNWRIIAAMGAALVLCMALLGFSIDVFNFCIVLSIAGLYGVVGWNHLRRKPVPDVMTVFALTSIGQLIFIVGLMGPLTYVGSALNFPLQDKLLLAIDHALGFDPKAYLEFCNARPELAMWLEAGYGMIKWPLLGAPVILGMTNRPRRLQVFVTAFAIALIGTLVISALMPAIGTYEGLDLAPESMTNLNTAVYAMQLHDIPAVRDGSLRALEIFKLAGIVAFPSFHAASAVLYGWALWPVRGFGPLLAVLNLIMLAATPVIGAHYFIDVIGGVVLAFGALAVAKAIAHRLENPYVAPAPLATNSVRAG